MLLLTGRDDEAGTLLRQFGDEPSALWQYGAALWAFRRGAIARPHATAACGVSLEPASTGHFTGDSERTDAAPQSHAMGSTEEAVICVDELGDAWKATPGLKWLAAHAPAGNRRKRHRR